MSIILSIFEERPYLNLPTDWLGWFGLVFGLGVIVFLISRFWDYQKPWDQKNRKFFFILLILVPITSFFFGIRLPVWNSGSISDLESANAGVSIMILSAVPWVFAAGMLGPIQGAVLAGLSGTIIAFWDTHSPYTIIEVVILAVLIFVIVTQRFKSSINKGLSEPFVSSYLLCFIYPALFSLSSFFYVQGSIPEKANYIISNIIAVALSINGPILLAGLFAETIKNSDLTTWGMQPPLNFPSKDNGIENRFLRKIVPISLILVILLVIGEWIIVRNDTQRVLKDRMVNGAEIVAEALPGFIEIGQNLISGLANDIGSHFDSPEEFQNILQHEIQTNRFFHQLYVIDLDGNSLAGYPSDDFNITESKSSIDEGFELASKGFSNQQFSHPNNNIESGTRLNFQTAVKDPDDRIRAVVLGRSEFEENPFTASILTGLRFLEDLGGSGYIFDEQQNLLYHPGTNPIRNSENLPGTIRNDFYSGTTPDGNRLISYVQAIEGSPWLVAMTLPLRTFQQLTTKNLLPLIGIVGLLLLAAVFLVRTGFRSITTSMKTLTDKTDRMTREQLKLGLEPDYSVDDRTGDYSFEQIKNTLKARLDELNHLLIVSQGVASSLNMESASKPILESALSIGAQSARIVLKPSMMPVSMLDSAMPSRFGIGESTNSYSFLDDQILALMEQHTRLVFPNPGRTTLLEFKPGDIKPESLLLIALHHEDQYFGSLWIAHDTPHSFSEEEVRFITTLSGQAGLAAAKNRLFWSAEFERQRLTAILASTPDPVVVTDHKDQLLLVNPAAKQVLGVGEDDQGGYPIEDVIPQNELVQLIKDPSSKNKNIELALSDGRFYMATTSSIIVDEKPFGKVCVLRDVTNFKELDALKSEFVATVSHDLRSPLTLLSGYAKMLEMVGGLNEQQESYVQKIVLGVDSMSRLINNLLDLGRIEADIKLQLETLLVTDIIEEVTESLQLKANQKRIKINIEIPQHESLLVEADQAMLHQAFFNLLENAIKYSPGGKDINVKVESRNGDIVFSFQDSGIGISPVDNPRLFEKFFRSANRDAIKERGTGLGLAIVKSIADRHSGRVWVDSQLGKGSIFYFEIPRSQTYNKRRLN